MGSIEYISRKRPNGDYEYTGKVRAIPWNAELGKKGPTKVFERESQAHAYIKRIEGEIDGDYAEQGIQVRRQPRRVRFADYVTDCAATAPGELATRDGAKSHARALAAHWPHAMVDEIDRASVRAYIAQLRETGLSGGTCEKRLGRLRTTMAAAVEDGLRGDDPTVGVTAYPTAERHHRVLTDDEFTRVVAQLPPWLQTAALLSHDAGLRIGEVCGLRWFRVDLLHRTIAVADVIETNGRLRDYPKGRKVLTVPLTARLAAALDEHQRTYPTGRLGHVFHAPNSNGQRLTLDRIRSHWRRARTAAKLDEPLPRWHDLRHSCATALARAGAPAYVIQQVLRHQNMATSQRYIDRTGIGNQATNYLDRAFGDAATDTDEVATKRGA